MNETILQAVRGWVQLATGLPSDRVIPADDAGVRPGLPYITVNLTTAGIGVGEDEEQFSGASGSLVSRVVGQRRATVTLNAYGRAGADLLEACQLTLRTPAVRAHLDAQRITVEDAGATMDVSELVDTRREKRFVKEFFLAYAVAAPGEAIPHMERFAGEFELDADPDPTDPLIVHVEHPQ